MVNKAESNRKKGKGRAQYNSEKNGKQNKKGEAQKKSNTPKSNRKKAKGAHK